MQVQRRGGAVGAERADARGSVRKWECAGVFLCACALSFACVRVIVVCVCARVCVGPSAVHGCVRAPRAPTHARPRYCVYAFANVTRARQIMRSERDEAPVLIETGMKPLRQCKWNSSGTVLALAGSLVTQVRGCPPPSPRNHARAGPSRVRPSAPSQLSSGGTRDISQVQFYSPWGRHLRTLKVPGAGIASLSWEGGGLRIALAVDCYVCVPPIGICIPPSPPPPHPSSMICVMRGPAVACMSDGSAHSTMACLSGPAYSTLAYLNGPAHSAMACLNDAPAGTSRTFGPTTSGGSLRTRSCMPT